jgi:hypothetical protein
MKEEVKASARRSPSSTAIREALGFIGVVASLVFVGLQIRQNTSVARGQTRQQLAALNQEWLILVSTDSAFRSNFQKAWMQHSDSLTRDEAIRANWGMRLNMRRLENTYFQFAEGLIDESALNSYGFSAGGTFKGDRFQKWWNREKDTFDPGFVKMFDQRYAIPATGASPVSDISR